MNTRSHVSAVVAARGHLLFRVDGKNDSKTYWSYVLVHAHKFIAFKQALATGALTVQQFGKVLAWGEGNEPDDVSKRMLQREFGFELIA